MYLYHYVCEFVSTYETDLAQCHIICNNTTWPVTLIKKWKKKVWNPKQVGVCEMKERWAVEQYLMLLTIFQPGLSFCLSNQGEYTYYFKVLHRVINVKKIKDVSSPNLSGVERLLLPLWWINVIKNCHFKKMTNYSIILRIKLPFR